MVYIIINISPRPLVSSFEDIKHTWGRSGFGGIMANKGFKTIEEQLSILKGRGLIVPDEEVAKDFLRRNNYYRISGYSLTLRSHDVFNSGATFQNIMDIYRFDHELRHVLLHYLEIIEVTVKSVYAHEFTKRHGATDYLNPDFFSDTTKHKEIIEKAEKQKNLRLPHEAYLKHFVDELQQDIPLWAYVDLLTIADISFLFKISQSDVKDATALVLGLNVSGASLLERFMHSMTIIRNLCAHGSRLYNRLFEQKPSLKKREQSILRKNEDGTMDNAHLFGYILIMRRLLKQDEFAEMKNRILKITQKYPFVSMRYYGFPDNWKSVL